MFRFPLRSAVAGAYLPRMGRLYRVQTVFVGPRICLQARLVFTDNYLGVDKVKMRQLQHRTQIQGPEEFKERVKMNFNASELKNIFNDEIEKFLYLSKDSDGLEFSLELIKKSIINAGPGGNVFKNVWDYFYLCHVLNKPLEAIKAWDDPTIGSTTYLENTNNISVLYFDLLLKNQMYDQLLATFSAHEDNFVKQHKLVMLTSLACYKIGTTEALKTLTKILSKHAELNNNRISGRASVAGALLAHNLEENATAKAIVDQSIKMSPVPGKETQTTFLLTSMNLMILANSGRLEEAMDYIRANILPTHTQRKKSRILYIAVESVVRAAKQSNRKGALKEVMEMVKQLEEHSEVHMNSFEDMLFKPIDGKEKEENNHRFRSSRSRRR